MKNPAAIHTDIATVGVSPQGYALVGSLKGQMPSCIFFEDLDKLGQAISAGKIKVRRWAVCVPHQICICKKISLPTTNLAEAVKMVEFELPSRVPIPLEELTYGCTLATSVENSLTLWVYAIRLSVLERYLEDYRTIGLNVTMITVDALALHRWATSQARGQVDKALIFAEFGDNGLFLATQKGHLQQMGSWNLQANGVMQSLLPMLQETLQGHQQPDGDIGLIQTSGTDVSFPRLDTIQEHINHLLPNGSDIKLTPVDLPDPLEWCSPWNGEHGTRQELLEACTVVLGTLLQTQQPEFIHQNLAPRQWVAAQQQRVRQRRLLNIGSRVLLIMLLGWTLMWAINRRLLKQIERLDTMMEPFARIADHIDSKRAVVVAVERQRLGQAQLLQSLEDIYRFLPDSVYLNQIVYESRYGKTSVDLKGYATQAETTLDIPARLQAASLLNQVRLTHFGGEEIQEDGSLCAPFSLHGKIE